MLLLLSWLALAWCLPAVLAGVLGWSSAWGSGSVVLDYLTPLPVAGGVLHVPILFAVTVLLRTQPWPAPAAGYARGLLALGSALAVVMLVDLNQLDLALTTDTDGYARLWQANPAGLFLMSDTVLAQFWLRGFGGREPGERREWLLPALLIVLGMPFYAAIAMRQDPRHDRPFIYAGSRDGPGRSDETRYVFTRADPGAQDFQAAALAYAADFDPRFNVNAEDVAIRFHVSLAAAEQRQDTGAAWTLCLYEDGTPPKWWPGDGDCFAVHQTFDERLQLAYDATTGELPPPVRAYLARRTVCATTPPVVMPPGRYDDNLSARACAGLDDERAALLRSHAGDVEVSGALQ